MQCRLHALSVTLASFLLMPAFRIATAEDRPPTDAPHTNHQIGLRVSILEVSLTKLQYLGIDLKSTPAQSGLMGPQDLAELQADVNKVSAAVRPAGAVDDPPNACFRYL
jgi:hypothetical protein